MEGNLNLPKGVYQNGKRFLLSLSWLKKRYRITTTYDAIPANINKAAKLLAVIQSDLERNQFHIANYQRLLINPSALEHLDVNYNVVEKNINVAKLFMDVLNLYDEMYKSNQLAIGSLHCYKYAINKHLIPYFEKVTIDKVDTGLIEDFIKTLNCSKKRITTILVPFKQVIKIAIKQKLITINPFHNIDSNDWKGHIIVSEYKVEPFSTQEIELIINHCKHDTIKNFILTAFWTGMRLGEMFALTWDDIDFKKEIISVNKNQTINRIIKSPKTKAGIRDIEMTPCAKSALLAQKEITGSCDRVFLSPRGFIWSKTDMFGRYWRLLLGDAGVKYRNAYQLRHSFISHMLTLGNSPMVLYRMVGHENTEMIYKNYARFISVGAGVKLLKTN